MRITNIHEAKTHFSRLVARAQKGEEVIIGKSGKPVAKLIAYRERPKARKLGLLKGKVKVAPLSDELPGEVAAAFRGERD